MRLERERKRDAAVRSTLEAHSRRLLITAHHLQLLSITLPSPAAPPFSVKGGREMFFFQRCCKRPNAINAAVTSTGPPRDLTAASPLFSSTLFTVVKRTTRLIDHVTDMLDNKHAICCTAAWRLLVCPQPLLSFAPSATAAKDSGQARQCRSWWDGVIR